MFKYNDPPRQVYNGFILKSYFTNVRFLNQDVNQRVLQDDLSTDMAFENRPSQNYTYHFYRVQSPAIMSRVTSDVISNIIKSDLNYGGKNYLKTKRSRKINKTKKTKKTKKGKKSKKRKV